MKENKRPTRILRIIIVLTLVWYIVSDFSKDWRIVYEYKESDYKNYEMIANNIFQLLDDGKLSISKRTSDYSDKEMLIDICENNQIKELLKNKNNYFDYFQIINENVIYFDVSSLFHSAYGIAAIRNNAVLESYYENSGYDGGTSYEKMTETIYIFNAGT